MRAVTIDPARGADKSTDPRVAPQGAIARVENMRVDQLGRLVLRKGYTSLGVTVHGSASSILAPKDLHTLGGELVALGNHNATQTGIRAAYKYAPDARGSWRTEVGSLGNDNTADWLAIPAADSVRVVFSEHESVIGDTNWTDAAVSSDGRYVALATSDEDAATQTARVTVVEPLSGKVIFSQSSFGTDRNVRILAIGAVFYLFLQNGTTIVARTWDSAGTANTFTAPTTIATGVTAAPAAYNVAAFEGTTDYLLVFPTATGYTWRRFNAAHVQQTTTSVVSLADAPVDICGATGETVSVVNVRAVNGAELRTFNAVTGVLAVGPTNVAAGTDVYVWVSVSRVSSSQVICGLFTELAAAGISRQTQWVTATTAAHVLVRPVNHEGCQPVSKPVHVDGRVFVWHALGQATPRPYALVGGSLIAAGVDRRRACLAAGALDGLAKQTWTTATKPRFSQLARFGSTFYVGVMTIDPRDKTYRANLVALRIFSGDRRQGCESGGTLYLAGGNLTQYDGRVAVEAGFDVSPTIENISQSAGGGLTLLGVYTYQVVYRYVTANGDVTQSAPSAPSIITLTGANNQTTIQTFRSYSLRTSEAAYIAGSIVWMDVYRTEAGGSIPRLILTADITETALAFGGRTSFVDGVTDAVQQTGNALYTQGADGSVSGRLPLGLASPCTLITETDGRVIASGLERDNDSHLSIEGRPGESVGFVNDNLFFVKNPERVTAIVAGDDGRKFIFGRKNIRELVGQGPNAAGVGDISEPIEIENRVGAVDWKSVVKSEHGVFFQAQASDSAPRIYLLPRGASSALDASEGIRDLLESFPVVTSATRHEEEQLITFAIQNAAGTDGRLLHLDLKTSGAGQGGWRGRWIVDRVAALEAIGFPEVVSETIDVFPAVLAQTLTIGLPQGARVGDRAVAVAFLDVGNGTGITFGTFSGYTSRLIPNISVFQGAVWDKAYTTAALVAGQTTTLAMTTVSLPTAMVVKQWLIRGAHASQAVEVTSLGASAVSTWTLPTLTPTWGSARNLWFVAGGCSAAFTDTSNPVFRVYPTGFGSASRAEYSSVPTSTLLSMDSAFATRQLEATAIAGAAFGMQGNLSGVAVLIAIRPLTTGGTPPRATVGYQGRLVVCNDTDVLLHDPDAIGDLGSLPIRGEWESCDIYPMGTGGQGRHLSAVVLGELLGNTQLLAMWSYDHGVSWTGHKQFQLTPTFGYFPGSVHKLQWVPRRRKIEVVRLKLVQGDEALAALGQTAGFAINQVTLWFEDLAGPVRAQRAAGVGRNRV